MFAKSATLPLFATPVWGFDLPAEEGARINADLKQYVESWLTPRPEILPGETWQTTQDLHEKEAFAPLYPFVDQAIQDALKAFGVDDAEYVITGCWANVNPPGSDHRPHTHPNNVISGVYYLQTIGEGDEIVFHDPRPQAHVIQPVGTRPVAERQSMIGVEAKPGRMLLFPSWLRHSVRRNRTDRERISLSFNAMLSDYVAKHAAPQWRGINTDGKRV
ncbi:MAG: TIGR02466 family protein [Thalassobaculaceae bacterium]|nr:TIGR02466 family protein [Thalassobaculaceae bacterium]